MQKVLFGSVCVCVCKTKCMLVLFALCVHCSVCLCQAVYTLVRVCICKKGREGSAGKESDGRVNIPVPLLGPITL